MSITTEDIYALVDRVKDGKVRLSGPAMLSRFLEFEWIDPDGNLIKAGQQYYEKAVAIQESLQKGISIIDRKRITTVGFWQRHGPWWQFVLKTSTHKAVKTRERYPWTTTEGFLLLGKVPGFQPEQTPVLPREEYKNFKTFIKDQRTHVFEGYKYEPMAYQRETLSGPGVVWMYAEGQKPIPIQETFFDIMQTVHPAAEYWAKQFVTRVLTVCDHTEPLGRFSGFIGAIAAVNVNHWPLPKMFRYKK